MNWIQEGQKQPGMCNECSFTSATPDGGDSVHVNIGTVTNDMAFQPFMAMRQQVRYKQLKMDVELSNYDFGNSV